MLGKMRRVQGLHRLGSRGFSFPSEYSHPVSIETSSLVHVSNMQWCGKSYAASTSSETVEARKTRRRVTKDERRLMVEKYVNKYREMNEGKFPTATDVQKNAGGSYYVVRQIIQELIYNSKTSFTKPQHATFLENISVNKDEISGKVSQTKKVSQTSISAQVSLTDETQPILWVDDRSKGVGPQSDHSVNEHKTSVPYASENDIKDSVHGVTVKFDGLQPKSESQKPTESEVSGRESHSAPPKDAEPQMPSSLWRNLWSFANEILGMRKRS